MGRKLDLSGLTDTEAEHVLQVVQRDMRLRKKEEERLSELKQELDEEGSRCLLLSRQSCFNRRCCIRCCSPFTFLLNPKRRCCDCHYNVCKACCVYNKKDKDWLCSTCQKTRSLKTQSLEWFYTNVKNRFKRFGSAKVLKTLYRKHLAEHSALSELTEGSAYEESICNEGSICGSDSTFYRQTEEHSMEETLTVALRVAEEAIDEAISKAAFDTDSQEKQNEANYLREHRGELIEELAKTIVQKIIHRRKTLAEMRAGYDQDWPLKQGSDVDHRHHHQSGSGSLKHPSGLWRSQSAFSLLDNDSPASPGLIEDAPPALQKEGGGSALSTWKSVDRLDNAVLKSPDGNWIALQSTQLSRPSLLTQRKSLVYSALERESGVVSAYEGMDSDDESRPELDSSWGAALQEIHRKMTDSNFISSPRTGRRGSRDDLFSDSEGNWKQNKPLLALLRSKVPAEIRRPSSSRRTSIIDVNFNVDGSGGEERVGKVRRSRRKRKSKKEAAACLPDYSKKENHSQPPSDAVTPDTLTSGGTTPEPYDSQPNITGEETNQMQQELTPTQQEVTGRLSDLSIGELEVNGGRDVDKELEEKRRGSEDGHEEEEKQWSMEIDLDEGRTEEDEEEEKEEEDEEEMKSRLYRLVAHSRLTYFSSTDDELDGVGLSGGEEEEGDRDGDVEEDDEEQTEEKTDRLSFKLCQLEKEVRASQFSSTEDELDRVGVMEEEEDGKDEELAVKVCRLVHQVNATQFSSTEDELDRGEEDEEEAMEEDALWKLQAENAVQAARVRDLAGLVSASQFSSSEDQLDRFDESEREVDEGGIESSVWEEADGNNEERRESFGDLDVNMFDLKDEIEEREIGKVLDGRTKDRTEEERVLELELPVKGHECGEKVSKEVEETRETDLEAVWSKERREEIIASHETKMQQENKPEAKWSDKDEEEEEEEDIRKRKESQGKWEEAGEQEDSDGEDEEFDRIISSMLMMTLEDMQGETFKENGRSTKEKDEEDEMQVGGTFKDEAADARDASGSEVTGRGEEFQSQDGNAMLEETPEEEEKSGEKRDGVMKIQEETAKGGSEREETDERHEKSKDTAEQSGTFSHQEGFLSPEEIHIDSDMEFYRTMQFISTLLEQRYSASSLRSITTEVLKVLNATEELLQGVEGGDDHQRSTTSTLPPDADPKKLDQQFARLEENVYVAAGAVYGLEAELGDLEECARGICSATSDMELSFLEEQVASAAAKVQQSDLQISDISARIAALKTAGLNVDTQSRFTKTRAIPVMPVTLDSSRQLRRRLPAPPVKDKET